MVAIPAFNAGEILGEVLRAVKAQVREGDRILVLDDGSNDGTAQVAEAQGVECVVHPVNKGLATARNTLLSHCATELILYLDSDAVPTPGTIDLLRDGFNASDVAGTGGRGMEQDRSNRSARFRADHCPQDHGEQVLESDWMLMGLCFCFRADALREVGGFDTGFTSYGEDVDVSVRLRACGYRLRYFPDAIVSHHRTDGFVGVLRQGYGHTYFASKALLKNKEHGIVSDYAKGIRSHLLHVTTMSLKAGDVGMAGIAFLNLITRQYAIWRARRDQ